MYLLENVFYGELDLSGGDIGTGDTTFTLESGDVGRLSKTPTSDDPMIFMVWDKAYEHAGAARKAGGKWELFLATGKDAGANTLTAGTRGFSNSSAQAYSSSDNTTYGIVLVAAEEVFTQYRSVQMADQWRLTTSFTGDAAPIASNLERVDTNSFAQIGSGMTETSGVFTFPEEGIYLVKFNHGCGLAGDSSINQPNIQSTTDGTNYSLTTSAYSHISQVSTDTTYTSGECSMIFNVTDVSTHKVRFHAVVSNNSVQTAGSTSDNLTFMTFIKLGDV